VEWVLDHDYIDYQVANRTVSQTLVLTDTSEGSLIPLMELLLAEYPNLRLACLPHADGRREVELSLKGDPEQVVAGMSRLRVLLQELAG